MREESINLGGVWLKRVPKPVAKKCFNAGNDIFLLPVNMNACSMWVNPYCTDLNDGKFENVVNRYEYYNCNKEAGKYCKFYTVDVNRSKKEGVF